MAFGFMPKTISYGERFILVLTCDLTAKGNFLYFVTTCHIVNLKLCGKMCLIVDDYFLLIYLTMVHTVCVVLIVHHIYGKSVQIRR